MTNGDLISRSALLEVYERLTSGLKDSNNGTIAGFIRAITKHIKLAPAVDAVEVPNCEECFWNESIRGWCQCEHCIGNTSENNNFLRKSEVHDDGK